MLKKILIGGIGGGIIMFCWLGLAWSTWHMSQFKTIPEDRAVMGELALRNMDSGLYYYPGMPPDKTDAAAMEAWTETMNSGPTISMMAYQKGGSNPDNPFIYVRGAIYCIFGACLLSWMLALAAPSLPKYFSRVLFCSAAGMLVAFSGPLLTGNFFQYPPMHSFFELFDQLVGWTMVGLLLALVCRSGAARAELKTAS